jgi:hypothetical protein
MIKSVFVNRQVTLSPSLMIWGLLIGILLAWPLLIVGRPTYLGDSASYYKGGHVAVAFIIDKFKPVNDTGAASFSQSSKNTSIILKAPQVRAVRSITYSVLAYVLGAPRAQLILLAVGQALLTGLVSVIVLNFYTPARHADYLVAAAFLAFATPVAFVTSLALPDTFTGLMVIAITLLAIGSERLSFAAKLALLGVGSFGVSAHSSHPPLAAGLTLLAMIWLIFLRRSGDRSTVTKMAWTAAPLLLGVALTVFANQVGFGEASIAAKRFPLTLARSVADGPGRWYLEKHCANEHYAICEVYPHGFPNSVPAFLWGNTGVETRATPEQMDRIRSEELTIVAAATREYLGIEMLHLSTSFIRQLVKIGPDAAFDQQIQISPFGEPQVVHAPGVKPWLGYYVEIAALISSGFSLLFFALRFRTFDVVERAAILLTIAALLINAAICVYFSGVADRYQARVVWLIPLLALAISRQRNGQNALPSARGKLSGE